MEDGGNFKAESTTHSHEVSEEAPRNGSMPVSPRSRRECWGLGLAFFSSSSLRRAAPLYSVLRTVYRLGTSASRRNGEAGIDEDDQTPGWRVGCSRWTKGGMDLDPWITLPPCCGSPGTTAGAPERLRERGPRTHAIRLMAAMQTCKADVSTRFVGGREDVRGWMSKDLQGAESSLVHPVEQFMVVAALEILLVGSTPYEYIIHHQPRARTHWRYPAASRIIWMGGSSMDESTDPWIYYILA